MCLTNYGLSYVRFQYKYKRNKRNKRNPDLKTCIKSGIFIQKIVIYK